MSNEYLKSLIDTVSGIEVKSEAEQIAKYELIEYAEQLQNNRNELKKWLKQIQDFHIEQRGLVDNEFNYSLESEDIDVLEDVLHKMQELENRKV